MSLLMIMLLMAVAIPAPMVLASDVSQKTLAQKTPTASGTQPITVRKGPRSVSLFKPELRFSTSISDLDISTARVFPEPLVPMSNTVGEQRATPASGEENKALADALSIFKARKNLDDASSLTNFIGSHPSSRWRPALELNLGLFQYERGYLTDALTYLSSAWEAAKNETERAQKATADRAIGELVMLEARLGRTEELQKHLSEIAKRPLLGSVETQVDEARGGLQRMLHTPANSYKCGPYALNTLFHLNKATTGQHPIIRAAASTSKGTNLAQLKEWADQMGMKYQMAKREKNASFVVPCVMHWKVGHFGAITAFKKGKYQIKDPTFGTGAMVWITPQALDSQTDGYFLIPNGPLPSGWNPVTKKEAESVWGRGDSQNQNQKAKGKGTPKTNPTPPGCGGMASAAAFTMQATLNIMDTPASYRPPVGPNMDFSVNYNYLEADQPATFTFPNFGPDWSFNWVAYLQLDASLNAQVFAPGGGSEVYKYTFPDNVSNPYPPDVTSQGILTIVGVNAYQRQLPDGSIEVYNQPDGTGKIFMTQMIDPQGNSAFVQYDANFRITSITDAIGQVTTLTYVSNTVGNVGYYKVSRITDPFGRQANFAFDPSTTFLVSITDVINLVSQFVSDATTSLITAMTTPYGTTSFYQYTPPGGTAPTRGLRFNFPDNSSAVLENWIGEVKSSYYWDRHQTALYPSDPANMIYTHCTTTKFLFDASQSIESPVINFVKPPLESAITYTTEGETGGNYLGTTNRPIQISRLTGGNVPQNATLYGTITGGDVVSIVVHDDGLTGDQETINYTVKPGDTLNITVNFPTLPNGQQIISYMVTPSDTLTTIATALTAAINANTNLQGIGVTATSNASLISISSTSPAVTYSTSTNVGATETMTLGPNSSGSTTVTIGGTPFGGDTLSSIASALTALINANSDLQGINVSATSTSVYIIISSNSSNITTYTTSTSGAATEIVVFGLNGNRFATATISGTVTTGDTLYLKISDAGLPGGQQQVSYTVQASDTTLSDVAAGLAQSVNNNSNLQTVGVRASQSNAVITLQSIDVATYSQSTSPGATEAISLNSTTAAGLQIYNYQFNASGNVTQSVDPIGRTFSYLYSANNIDILEKRETKNGNNFLIGKWIYNNGKHVPNIYIDGSGQQTQYSYNSFGELVTLTDANSNISTFSYITGNATIGGTKTTGDVLTITVHDPALSGGQQSVNYTVQSVDTLTTIASGIAAAINANSNLSAIGVGATSTGTIIAFISASTNLTTYTKSTSGGATETITLGTANLGALAKINGPLSGNNDITTFTYDSFNRLATVTDSEGYTLSYSYDAANRLTQILYPDATSDQIIYEKLDAIMLKDRIDRWTTRSYDSMDQLAFEVDPLSRRTSYVWCNCGSLASLTDPANHTTNWEHDIEGRITKKIYADGSDTEYKYEDFTSRLELRTDALNQKANYSYNIDNTLSQVNYTDIVNPTSTVHYTYDQNYLRIATVQNGWGRNTYTYNPVITNPYSAPTTGGGRLASVTNSLIPNAPITATIEGSVTTGNILTITVTDPGLPGGEVGINYTVQSGDSLASIATGLKNAINANSSLQSLGVTATSSATVITLSSTSSNVTTYFASKSSGSTESVVLSCTTTYTYDALNRTTNRSINGSTNSNTWTYDALGRITAESNTLGNFVYQYIDNTPGSSKGTLRLSSITYPNSQVTNFTYYNNNGDQRLQQISNLNPSSQTLSQFGYSYNPAGEITQWTQQRGSNTAVQNNFAYDLAGQLITNQTVSGNPSPQYINQYFYYAYDPASNRTTVQVNGSQTATIGGTITASDTVTITIIDSGLSGGQKAVNYTVQGGDTLTSIATALKNAINADANLQAINVSATSNAAVVSISSQSVNATNFSGSASGGATETVTVVRNTNVTQATLNNVNELTGLAAGGLTRFQGTTNKAVKSASVNSTPMTLTYSKAFTGNATLITGSNSASIQAVDGGNNTATLNKTVTVDSGSSTALTYDSDGNLTNDGTNTYQWDAENRLVRINYPGSGNNSQLTYDGLGRCVKIIEQTGGSTTSTKQFVWSSNQRCEERDAAGNLTKRFYFFGQNNSGTNYFYGLDHLGSIREMTNSSGTVQAQYAYDPYGVRTVIGETVPSDFQFAGYYFDSRSGLNCTRTRLYSPASGRWLSRDPLGEWAGTNLYTYVGNNPIGQTDPTGLMVGFWEPQPAPQPPAPIFSPPTAYPPLPPPSQGRPSGHPPALPNGRPAGHPPAQPDKHPPGHPPLPPEGRPLGTPPAPPTPGGGRCTSDSAPPAPDTPPPPHPDPSENFPLGPKPDVGPPANNNPNPPSDSAGKPASTGDFGGPIPGTAPYPPEDISPEPGEQN